ncbi:MAG: hypothetical protein JNJ71_11085 [Rubrivivax sp.]|nr:hypothetical protein [Rubrivivax sp.]
MSTAPQNPYPGLRPFHAGEVLYFFGREAQVDQMVDRLAATRFLAVVGGSGSGKSSLVNCGLIPALHRGLLAAAGTGWRIAHLRPGQQPLRALAQALARPGAVPPASAARLGDDPVDMLLATLRLSRLGLVQAWREAHLPPGQNNLLVVVDQFEELFRFRQAHGLASTPQAEAAARQEASSFVTLLLEAAAAAGVPLYVVLTMRSDYLGDCAPLVGLPEAINRGQYLVPRMTREERRSAITGPAVVEGVAVDPVLATQLVNDVGDNPDQLSILQHALQQTWACWQRQGGQGPLRPVHYDEAGGMEHALERHADDAFMELAEGPPQALCERIFRALTDAGTDARGVRRPTRLDVLAAVTGASTAELEAVMQPFRAASRAFLMPPQGEPLRPDDVIDISHESLMRVWSRLKRWVQDEAQSAQTFRRLAESAQLHADHQLNLAQPPELQMLVAWRERQRPTAAWAGRYREGFEAAMAYLADSEADHAASQAAASARLAREQQAQTAEQVRLARLATRRRWLFVLLGTVIVAAAALIGLIVLARQEQAAATKALAEVAVAKAGLADAQAAAERERLTADRNAQTLDSLRQSGSDADRKRIDAALAARPPLVYLQYADPAQSALAERLRVQLNGSGYQAPGIERVGTVPGRNELRFTRAEDRARAETLAAELKRWGYGSFVLQALAPRATTASTGQFELWLARPAGGEITRLVAQLNSPERSERLAAGQALVRYRASPEAIEACLDQLTPQNIGALSDTGRLNILFALARSDPTAWTPELARRGRAALRLIDERAARGEAAVGQQTRTEMQSLEKLLQGLAPP